ERREERVEGRDQHHDYDGPPGSVDRDLRHQGSGDEEGRGAGDPAQEKQAEAELRPYRAPGGALTAPGAGRLVRAHVGTSSVESGVATSTDRRGRPSSDWETASTAMLESSAAFSVRASPRTGDAVASVRRSSRSLRRPGQWRRPPLRSRA